MWMCVDRIEGQWAVLIDENGQIYHITATAYEAMTGLPPKEAHMVDCHVQNGQILTATYSEEETLRRKAAAKARLQRLRQKKRT